MWANLHAFEHNNLDGMTLFPAPKYGHTLLRSWARKTSIRYHIVDEGSANIRADNRFRAAERSNRGETGYDRTSLPSPGPLEDGDMRERLSAHLADGKHFVSGSSMFRGRIRGTRAKCSESDAPTSSFLSIPTWSEPQPLPQPLPAFLFTFC
jgi:hypothetical protein